MATTETGHHANRVYIDQDGHLHLNGANIYLDESGTAFSGTEAAYVEGITPGTGAVSKALILDANGDVTMPDLGSIGFGGVAKVSWDSTDVNANKMLIQLPAGGGTDVPVIVIGQSVEAVDMAIHNGTVDPTISILGVGAVTTGPVVEFRKSRGTAASPTVVTSGDDTGSINSYACVAAAEWVQNAQILMECTGTVATTRGPGVITFKTATDAAPSVLTTAMTISAAQLVTCAAGLTVTTGAVTVSSGNVVVTSGDLTLTSGNINCTAASDINLATNTAAALGIDDGTTDIVLVDTRNTVKDVNGVTISSPATTIVSETAAHQNPSLKLANKTITYTGTTGTTSQLGAMLNVGVLTITDASMMTLTTASAVHINALAAAGGMLTISNSRMISTSVSDCYLTNAGVWTDTSCWSWGKNEIEDAPETLIRRVLDKLVPKTWTYKTDVHGDDHDRERVGIVYDELPDELRAPGQDTGVSPGLLSSFALAAIKYLSDRVSQLEAKLA